MADLCATCRDQGDAAEQDHRGVKRVTRPMLGFKSCAAVQDTRAGIERHAHDSEGTASGRGVSSIGTGTGVKPFSFMNSTSKDDSASRIWQKPGCLAQYRTLFLSAQPSRGRLGFRQAATVPDIGSFLANRATTSCT
jgi:hypothetical protein